MTQVHRIAKEEHAHRIGTTADNLNDTEVVIPRGIVSLEQLRALPEPRPLGIRHRPVSHATIVEAVMADLERRRLPAGDVKWELTHEGARLDGRLEIIDAARREAQRRALVVSRTQTYTGIDEAAVQALLPEELQGGHGAVLTVSHANDQSLSLRISAGLLVFVCNNLAVATAGGGTVIRRKHTGDEPWDERLARMVEMALNQFDGLNRQVGAMRSSEMSDGRAKELIHDLFTMRSAPLSPSKFVEVSRTYFEHATPDVGGRTRWDLHNAFTRWMRELPERRQIEGSERLTRFLTQDLLAIEHEEVDPN